MPYFQDMIHLDQYYNLNPTAITMPAIHKKGEQQLICSSPLWHAVCQSFTDSPLCFEITAL